MLATIRNRLRVFKSSTLRWFALYMPGVLAMLEGARSQLDFVREALPPGVYKGIVIGIAVASVVGIAQRFRTTGPMSTYTAPPADQPKGE